MKAITLPEQSPEQLAALEALYRTTKDVRLRSRAQMILLAAERPWTARQISEVVRCDENTVRQWLRRYRAEGVEGLRDEPRPGITPKITAEYEEKLLAAVRVRPRSLNLEYSLWTLQRLADYMAEQTGIRVERETVRIHLAKHDIVISRPQHKVSSPDPDYKVKKRRLKPREIS
jgi:transposase